MAVLRKENAHSIVIYRLIKKKMKTKIQSRKSDSNFSQAAQCLSEGMLGSA